MGCQCSTHRYFSIASSSTLPKYVRCHCLGESWNVPFNSATDSPKSTVQHAHVQGTRQTESNTKLLHMNFI